MEENPTIQIGDGPILSVSRYEPIFVGYTDDRKKVVLYRKRGNTTDFHIRHPIDGQLWALSEANIDWAADVMNNNTTLTIRSPEWSGTAKGTRYDLVEEPDLLA